MITLKPPPTRDHLWSYRATFAHFQSSGRISADAGLVDIPRDTDGMVAALTIALPIIIKQENMGGNWMIEGLTFLERDVLFFDFKRTVSQTKRPPLGRAADLVRVKIVDSQVSDVGVGSVRHYTPTAKYVRARREIVKKLSAAIDTDRLLAYVDACEKLMAMQDAGKDSGKEYEDLFAEADRLHDGMTPEQDMASRAFMRWLKGKQS